MGQNFAFVTVIKKQEKPKLISIIKESGKLNDNNACIDFPLDEYLLNYLKQNIQQDGQWKWGNYFHFHKSDYRAHFPTDETGRIGYIYFELVEIPDTDLFFATFTACTNRMTQLFCESPSVKTWFIELGKKLNAFATFLDTEDWHYELLFKGKDVSEHFNFEETEESEKNGFVAWLFVKYDELVY